MAISAEPDVHGQQPAWAPPILALSRCLVAFTALLAALSMLIRRKAQGLTSKVKQWGQRVEPYLSKSDAVFLVCLLVLWSALYAACVYDGQVDMAAPVLAAPLSALESLRNAFWSLPDLIHIGQPRVHVDPANVDTEELVRRLVASEEFAVKVKEVADQRVAPLKEEVLAKLEARMEALLASNQQMSQNEVAAKLDKLKAYAQEEIGRAVQRVRQNEKADAEAKLKHLQLEMAALKASNEDMAAKLSLATSPEDTLALTAGMKSLEGQLNELTAARAKLEASCCKGPDLLRVQASMAVEEFVENVAYGGRDDKASRHFLATMETRFLSREHAKEEIERLALALSAEVKADLITWSERQMGGTMAAEEILANSTLVNLFRQKVADDLNAVQRTSAASSSDEVILGQIESALRVYDADKTGMFDFALESAGGSVASVRCTETHDVSTAVYSLFGVPFWWERNSPRAILQPGVNPGQCWAFKGQKGDVVIKLSAPIVARGVTLEHISRMSSPDHSISSAPKDFKIYGLKSLQDEEPALLGSFTFEDNGKPVQTFKLVNSNIYQLVEMKVASNWGNQVYTCIYRLRVHGDLPEGHEFPSA